MKVIQNLRLTLIALFSIIAIGAFGQGIVLSTETIRYGSGTGTPEFKVLVSDVKWSVRISEESSGWLKVVENENGGPNEEPVIVKLQVEANPTFENRQATIYIDPEGEGESQSIEFIQYGKDAYLVLRPETILFNESGGDSKISVESNADWKAEITEGKDWLSISPDAASGNKEAIVYAEAYDKVGERSGTITFTYGNKSQDLKITQKGSGYLQTTVAELKFNAVRSTQYLSINSNVDWEITIAYEEGESGWLTVDPTNKDVNGKDITTVSVTAEDNTANSSTRSATLTISSEAGVPSQIVTVTQTGNGYLQTSVAELKFNAAGSMQPFNITSNVNWKITVDYGKGERGWLSVTPLSKEGNDITTVSVTAEDNTANSSTRSATLTISSEAGVPSQIVTVTQTGNGYLQTSVAELKFNAAGSMQPFNITSNVNWKITVDYGKGESGWLSVDPTNKDVNGKDITTVSVTAEDNTANSSTRSATLTISSEAGVPSQIVTVTQTGNGYLQTSVAELKFNAAGSMQPFNITSNVNWKITVDYGKGERGWLSVTPLSKEGNDITTVSVTAEDNTANSSTRSATLTISSGEGVPSQTVTVTQTGNGYLQTSVAELKFNAVGSTQPFNITSNVSWNITVDYLSGGTGWLSVTPLSKEGNDITTVSVTAEDNTSNSSTRSATLTISSGDGVPSQIVTVTQTGNGYLQTSVAELKFNAAGSMQPFNITSNVSWKITVDYGKGERDWLSVTPLSKEGNDITTVSVTAEDNTANNSTRSATLTISSEAGVPSQMVTVTQTGNGYLQTSVAELKFNAAGSMQPFNISSNVSWNIAIDYLSGGTGWLSVTPLSKEGNDITTISVTAEDNTSNSSTRSATLTISSGDGVPSQIVTVTQTGNGYLQTSVAELKFNAAGSTQPFNISSNVSWKLTVDYLSGGTGWLNVTPLSKEGNDITTVSVTAEDNTANSSTRSATLTISSEDGVPSQIVTVTQTGNGYLQTSVADLKFNAVGSTQTFNISSNVNWYISVEGGSGWLAVTPLSKEGNDITTVSVTAEDNTANSITRSATLTISSGDGVPSQIVTITQTGNGYLQTSIAELKFNPSASEQHFTISSNVKWAMMLEGGDGWLTVSPVKNDETTEKVITVIVSATANTGSSPRSAKLTISSEVGVPQVVEIIQSGSGYLQTNVSEMKFSPNNYTLEFKIESNVTWNIAIDGGAGWLTVDPLSGNGDRVVHVSVTRNNGNRTRNAKLTLSGEGLSQVITIQQAGTGNLSVNKSRLEFNPDKSENGFTITSNVEWSIVVEGGGGWLALSDYKGEGTKNITVFVEDNNNNSQPRDAVIIIDGDGITEKVKVYQAGTGILSVDRTSIRFSDAEGSESVKITSNVKWMVDISDKSGWLTVSSFEGMGDTLLNISVKSNTDNSRPREAVISITGEGLTQKIDVFQSGTGNLSVNKSILNFNEAGGTDNIEVTSNISDWKAYVDANAKWVSIERDENNDNIIKVTVEENSGSSSRSADIIVEGGGLTETIKVKQSGTAYLKITPSKLKFGSGSGSSELKIESNVEWEFSNTVIAGGEEWIEFDSSPGTYTGDKTINVEVTANENNSSRESKIEILWNDGTTTHTEEVSVFQDGYAYLTVTTDQIKFGNASETKTFSIESNVSWNITISDEENKALGWLKVDPEELKTESPITTIVNLTAQEFKNRGERKAILSINWYDGVRYIVNKIDVIQSEQQSDLIIQAGLEFDGVANDGKSLNFSIQSNNEWKVYSKEDWIKFNDGNCNYSETIIGVRNKTVDVYISKNSSLDPRYGKIFVELTDGSIKDSISVKQKANFEFTEDYKVGSKFTVAGGDLTFNVSTGEGKWWEVTTTSDWLKIKSQDTNNGKITLHADFNESSSVLQAEFEIKYQSNLGTNESLTRSISQNSRPKIPKTIDITGFNKDGYAVSEIDKECSSIKLDTSNFDQGQTLIGDKTENLENQWNYEWEVGDVKVKGTTFDFKPTAKQKYIVTLTASYKDAPDKINTNKKFDLYPAPVCPKTLVEKKGKDGVCKSRIMIAGFEAVSDETLKSQKYEFVFGYRDKNIDKYYQLKDSTYYQLKDSTKNDRYYQYDKTGFASANKWVYTQWEIGDETIKSLTACDQNGKQFPIPEDATPVSKSEEGEIGFSEGRMVASVPEAASAEIVVVSADGTVVRHIVLPPATTFDVPLGFDNLSSGFYFVKCVIGNINAREKFLVR